MLTKAKWLILGIFITLPMSALAFNNYSGNLVVLDQDKVVNGNYYAAGNIVEIKGTVNGDVFVAGNSVVISSDNIHGDVFVAASNIDIRGKVDGSLRLVGENIDLAGQVTRNAMVAGQIFRVDENANVVGHLTFWGQILNVAGQAGSVEGAFSNLLLSGKVDNNVDIYLAEPIENAIQVSDQAVIGGTLYYQGLNKLNINPKASIGDVSFNKIIRKDKEENRGVEMIFWIIKFFAMLTVGMIALQFWPKIMDNSYGAAYKHPVKNFFIGFLFLILVPLVCILLAITVIGIPLAIIIMVLWGILLYVAGVMAAWLIGRFIKDKFFSKTKWHNLWILALGLFIYIFVGKIPFLGWLLILFTYLLAWGVFYSIFKIKKD